MIKRTTADPCIKVKISMIKKKIPGSGYLNADTKGKIQDFLSTYLEYYTSLKYFIYYDVKARPVYHFKAFHKLAQLYEALTFYQESKKFKSFSAYPLHTSYIVLV